MASIARVVAVRLTGGCEGVCAHGIGVWRSIFGIMVRNLEDCFRCCCSMLVRSLLWIFPSRVRAPRSSSSFCSVRARALARIPYICPPFFSLPSTSSRSNLLSLRLSPRILDDRIYDKRHCCCRARARCAHPAVPGLSPSQSSANACYVICCRMSLPTHATPSSARSPRTHPFALSSQPY